MFGFDGIGSLFSNPFAPKPATPAGPGGPNMCVAPSPSPAPIIHTPPAPPAPIATPAGPGPLPLSPFLPANPDPMPFGPFLPPGPGPLPLSPFLPFGPTLTPTAPSPTPLGPVALQGPTTGPSATAPAVDPNAPAPATPGLTPPVADPVPDPKKIKDTANKLFQAMDGWGTDEAGVMSALRSCSTKAETDALKAEYQKHFGRSLDDDLKGELGEDDLKEAQAAMSGDPKEAAKAGLKQAVEGWGTDESKVFAILEELKPEDRLSVIEDLKAKGIDVMGDLGGRDASLASAMIGERDPQTGEVKVSDAKIAAVKLDQAMNGGFLGLGTDEAAINDVLEKVKPEDRAKLEEEYKKVANENSTFGDSRTLDQALGDELSGAEKDIATALKAGNSTEAAAARIKAAAEGWGTDEGAIFKTLEGIKDKAERDKVIAAYNEKYGKDFKPDPNNPNGPKDALEAMLHDELGAMDEERAKQLKAEGKLTDEFALKYAMSGVGTDEEMLKATLKGKSKAEIDALAATYAAANNGASLFDDIRGETSGRDGKELDYMIEHGEPKTPQEKIAYANEMYAFERDGWTNGVSRFFVDMYSDSGEVLDMQNKRMNDTYNQATEGGKKEIPDTAKAELAEFIDYNAMDLTNYQTAKDKVADTAAGTAAVVVAGVLTIATAGGAAPGFVAALGTLGIGASAAAPIAAAVAAGGGGLASIIMKSAIKTGSYSNEEIGIDVAKTVASMVTAGTLKVDGVDKLLGSWAGAVTQNPFAQNVVKGAISGGIQNGSGGFVEGALDEKNYQGDFADWLTGVGGNTLLKGAGGMTGGALGETFNGLMPANAPAWMNPYFFGGLKGGVKGAGTGLGGNVFEGKYSGNWEDIALNWGKPVWENTFTGMTEGIGDARKADFQQPTPAPTTQPDPAPAPAVDPATQNPAPPTQTPAAPTTTTPAEPARLFPDSPLGSDADVIDRLNR